VRALTRDPGKHRDLGDEVVEADLNRSETLRAAFEEAHGVFLVTNVWEEGTNELITGFFSRVSAFGVAVNMLVAALAVHASNGLFMNWSGNQKGEGFEYHVLAIGLALVVIISGAGKWSIDRLLAGRLDVRHAELELKRPTGTPATLTTVNLVTNVKPVQR